jgi:HEAT repeat protein
MSYEPPSEFLRAVVNGDVPLVGSDFAAGNLRRVIAMTKDEDPANRDWATFLLAGTQLATPEVREALIAAAEDENECVRSEAILGISYIDKTMALPLLQRELARESVVMPTLEAAAVIAHPSLVADLRRFTSQSEHRHLDELAAEALKACETGKPAYDR